MPRLLRGRCFKLSLNSPRFAFSTHLSRLRKLNMAVSADDSDSSSSRSSRHSVARQRSALPPSKAALSRARRKPSSRASSSTTDESVDVAEGRRDTLSTLVMSEAEERLLSSSSGSSEEEMSNASSDDDDDHSSSSSDATLSSYASSSSCASTSSSSVASSVRSKHISAPPMRSSMTVVRPSSPAPPTPEATTASRQPTVSSSVQTTTPRRRSSTKRRHVFDSPQYRADAFFDPSDVAIVRSPIRTSVSADRSAADSSTSTPVAAAHAAVKDDQQLNMPLPPVCLSDLIAASTPPSTPRKTPRRARPRPTDTWHFIARSPHPFAWTSSSSASAVATPLLPEMSTTAASETSQPVPRSSCTVSPPSSPDFPPASLIRASNSARPTQSLRVKQELDGRTERRKSGNCCSVLRPALQVDVIELECTSGSEEGTPVGRSAVKGKGRVGKRRIILSDSEDGSEAAVAEARRVSPAAPVRPPAEVVELSSSEDEPPSPPVRRPPPPSLSKASYLEEDDDVVPETDDEGVLHWSPPPPPKPSYKPVTPAARKKTQPLQSVFRQPSVGVDLSVYDSPPSSPVRPAIQEPVKTPAKKASGPRSAKSAVPNINSKAWKTRREALALDIIRELDASVFDHLVLPTLHLVEEPSAAIADLKEGAGKEVLPRGVTWTGRLKTTAGMSRWTRRMVRGVWEHHCCIELSSKVRRNEIGSASFACVSSTLTG